MSIFKIIILFIFINRGFKSDLVLCLFSSYLSRKYYDYDFVL
jgi:hypothetical protein